MQPLSTRLIMSSADPTSPTTTATYEPLSPRSAYSIRSIPNISPLDLSADHQARLPLLSEKLARRESRLGLKSIFGRSKTAKNSDGPTSNRLSRTPPAARLSLAEAANPHYSSPYSKTVALSQISRPLSTTIEDAEATYHNAPSPVVATGRPRTTNSQTNPPRCISSWDAPPLFKAYPQAVRYATLPAPSTSADALMRAQEKMSSANVDQTLTAQTDEKSKVKKKHRRIKSGNGIGEFTDKIYILVTSGYLLEYASEGPFDRLPEKTLHLTKNSAAFASDLIPGRHWVLQVASAMGCDGALVADSNKSFFSRFRSTTTTKRQTSNMLLVFDSAEEMDEWLATVRRAIEALGGKKSLSETGKPKVDKAAQLREQTSQRTLVVRDPQRYSRSIPHDLPWEQDYRRESDASLAVSDITRERSMDNISATDSMISHDGQQLESLRSSQHRLSCISSGQRTMLTSTTSSPSCSPTVECFPEESSRRHLDVNNAEVRLRPNAAAIIDRRRSLQTMSPFKDMGGSMQSKRPVSTFATAPTVHLGAPSGCILAPNFSVPSNRRYSTARLSTQEPVLPMSPLRDGENLPRSLSRRPPKNLRISRRLSMVADQPSPPWENVHERPVTGYGESRRMSQVEVEPLPTYRPESQSTTGPRSPSIAPQSPKFISAHNAPRRLSSLGALRQHGEILGPPLVFSDVPPMPSLSEIQVNAQEAERRQSSIDMYAPGVAISSPQTRVPKRSSMLSSVPDRLSYQNDQQLVGLELPLPAPPPTTPLPPVPTSPTRSLQLKSEMTPLFRQSMPQLVEGPPPAPPPTSALPPLPRKASIIR